jgi:hypothetical protein
MEMNQSAPITKYSYIKIRIGFLDFSSCFFEIDNNSLDQPQASQLVIAICLFNRHDNSKTWNRQITFQFQRQLSSPEFSHKNFSESQKKKISPPEPNYTRSS